MKPINYFHYFDYVKKVNYVDMTSLWVIIFPKTKTGEEIVSLDWFSWNCGYLGHPNLKSTNNMSIPVRV